MKYADRNNNYAFYLTITQFLLYATSANPTDAVRISSQGLDLLIKAYFCRLEITIDEL